MPGRLSDGLDQLIINAKEAGLATSWANLEASVRGLAERLGEKVTEFSLIGAFNVAKRLVEEDRSD